MSTAKKISVPENGIDQEFLDFVEKLLVAEYRLENPRSRAVRIVKYGKNTSATKQMECILCGECGPTWASQWPQTRAAMDWELDHVEKHCLEAIKFNPED